MMTLEEAIKHCKDVALSCTNKECALEHFQLLKWLQEYSNMLEKQGEQNLVKIPKFKCGDTIEFNGFGHTRYIIKEVCGTSHYINSNGERMDMSYTDANFKRVEQKPVEGSEEDKNMLDELIKYCEFSIAYNGKDSEYGKTWEKRKSWLNFLKDRVQPKQEWSEEDRKTMCQIFCIVKDSGCSNRCYNRIAKFLNNIISNPNNHWRPSDEQIKALDSLLLKGEITEIWQAPCLQSLYNDLKNISIVHNKKY